MAFKEIEKKMAGYEGPDLAHIVSAFADEDIPADDWPFEFAALILKGGLFDLREPAQAPMSEEVKGLEMMRRLVRIGREVAAKQSGQPHDEMIADNADMLVARHIAKYDEMTGPVSIPEQLYSSYPDTGATYTDRDANRSFDQAIEEGADFGFGNACVQGGLPNRRTQPFYETDVQPDCNRVSDAASIGQVWEKHGPRHSGIPSKSVRRADRRPSDQHLWVAQTGGIVYDDGVWRRVPYKTNASVSFFVLHNFLVEIGFPQWANEQGNEFIFRELMRLADPSKSASSYMTRLMEEAGIKDVAQEKFHSLRAGYISASGDEGIEARDRKLQAGHELGADEHELYGFKTFTETKARQIAYMPLPDIDLTPYRGLNFDELAKAKQGKPPVRAVLRG
ncbi:MAG TPA: hypothetical protein DHE23_21640 [Agrobacterium sp.]|nr:hypothetical protein [Agrobacterium sp.]